MRSQNRQNQNEANTKPSMLDALRQRTLPLEYDEMLDLSPADRAADAENRLRLRPQFEEAERDAGFSPGRKNNPLI